MCLKSGVKWRNQDKEMSHRGRPDLTRGRWGVEVDLLAVVSEPGLVAPPHPEHVDAVYLQPIHHHAGPLHLVQPLPGRRRAGRPAAPPRGRGSPRPPLVLHGKMPSLGRILRQPPAQEELVVSERLLSVYHRSQRRWVGGERRISIITFCISGHVSGGGCGWGPTAYELQAANELHLFGRIGVEVPEGGLGRQGETLELLDGFR